MRRSGVRVGSIHFHMGFSRARDWRHRAVPYIFGGLFEIVDFVFCYARLIDIEAAFLLEVEAKATFFSCREM